MSKKSADRDEIPSFILDSPLGQDLLEGKAQENIAQSIAELIRSGSAHTKLIGLDGAWGSGKSNLIHILESKLSDSHHFFVYDSWGHQEDPYRRSFLEELTSDLCGKGMIDSTGWGAKLRELLSQRRETLTKTIPRLSNGFITTALIVISTPFALTLAEVTDHLGWRFLVALSPIIVGALAWVISCCKERRVIPLRDIYLIYKEHQLTNETHETVVQIEPSVREFRSWMSEVSEALKKKKLVIVFDNMDRLPPDKVRELWSSIHTFFAENVYDGIWVIVPFDKTQLSRAFKNGDSSESDLSKAFLEKSFSVIFQVPPPVLSDWQTFFERKFDEAFKSEREEVLLVRKLFGHSTRDITPRNIISFINDMVALRLTTQEKIQLKYVAAFVLNKKDILENPVEKILNGRLITSSGLLLQKDAEFVNSMAALAYGVPLSSASQVALFPEILVSISHENTERLGLLSEHPNFIHVLELVVGNEDVSVEASATSIASLEIEENLIDFTDRMRGVWDQLKARVVATPITEQKFSGTHKLLLAHISEKHQLEFVRHLVRGYAQLDGKAFSGTAYFRALSDLNEFVQSNSISVDTFSEIVPCRIDADTFNDYARAAGSDYKRFKVTCNEDELNRYLIEKVMKDLQKLGPCSHFKELIGEYDFSPVIQLLEQKVANSEVSIQDVGQIYELYKAISKERPINLPNTQYLARLIAHVPENSSSLPDLLAMRLTKGADFPDVGGITAGLVRSTDKKLVEQVAQCIEYYESLGTLLLNHLNWSLPILKPVLSSVILNSNENSTMEIVKVLKNYDALYHSLSLEPEDFLGCLDGWSDYAKEEISSDNITEFLDQDLLLEHCMAVECDLSSHLVEMTKLWLLALEVEGWRAVFSDQSSSQFRLTRVLLDEGRLESLPENADFVFRDQLEKFARSGNSMNNIAEWETFQMKANQTKLKATAKNIRDTFILAVEITPEKFRFLAHLLMKHGSLKRKSGDVTRRILEPVANDMGCLQIMVRNSSQLVPIINRAGNDASGFKDLIKQKLASSDTSNELRKFAAQIGVEES